MSDTRKPVRPRILFVDDEPEVLQGLALNMRSRYDARTAGSGREGLTILAREGPFEVVVSDMRMPEMNGAEFLREVRRRAPAATRVLLTGYSDAEAAMAAVNEGGIFRYLKKPFPTDKLIAVLDEALAEHRLNRLREEDQARLMKDLGDLDALKENFLANVSHELRTPLTIMLSSISLLLTNAAGPLSADQMEIIEGFDRGSRNLLLLIEGLLEARELGEGPPGAAPESVSLGTLIDAIDATVAGLSRSPATSFTLHSPDDPRGSIETDCARIALIVRNLASNAFKFTDRGSVDLTVRSECGNLVIEVEDTGPGIPPDQVHHIFERFRQGDGSSTRAHGGVGLGLYIVKRSVEQLGGAIALESAPGKGSKFRVEIPGYTPWSGPAPGKG